MIIAMLSRLGRFSNGNGSYRPSAQIDWDLFICLAEANRVIPLLNESLPLIAKGCLPSDVAAQIKQIYLLNLKKNYLISSQLIRLTGLLKKNGIEVLIPFKGPAMSQFIYDDPALRPCNDLDLLISKKEAVQALLILMDNGYSLGIDIKPTLLKTYVEFKTSIELSTPFGLLIDLHWELTGGYSIINFDYDTVCKRLVKSSMMTKQTWHLSEEDLLVCLCLWGAKDLWNTIERIYAVATLLKRDLDWALIHHIAREKRCRKALALGVALANKMFNVRLPASKREILPMDIQELAHTTMARFSFSQSEVRNTDVRFSTFHFHIRDTFADKIRYCARLLFKPSSVDWDRYDLRPGLTFVYYIIRPFRLASNLIRR